MTTRLVAAVLACFALALSAGAQGPRRSPPNAETQPAAEAQDDLTRARGRWEHLTPEERRAFVERYREFRELDPAEQRALVERARRVRESVQRLTNELGPDVRDKLREMDPARRREAVREIVTDEARGKGLELRARLPDDWANRLEKATPEERPRILEEFRRRHLNRLANYAVERLGRQLGLSREEIDARIKLPFEQRAALVLEMRKLAQEHDASENGLPPGMSAQDWQELQQLPAERFYERLEAYRNRRIADQVAREARGEPRDPPLGDPRVLHRGPPPLESLRQLREALRPEPRDVVELMDLPQEERAQRLFELRRARCLAVIGMLDLAPPHRIDELRDIPEPAFVLEMRRLLGPLHAAERGLPPPEGGVPRLERPDRSERPERPERLHRPDRPGAPHRDGPPPGPGPNRDGARPGDGPRQNDGARAPDGPRRDERRSQDAARIVPGLRDGGIT